MESLPDENSPPRSDLVVKTRRQSALLDSPNRMTRSQSRRLSGAPVSEAAMSPKPKPVGRRHSVRISESFNDAASVDDASSVQDEAEYAKPAIRTRRSTRHSFADTVDEGSLPTRSTKLSSIEEDTKPRTRRTRASLKPTTDMEFEVSLPVTRRTRQSSVSSVTSVSTIASNVSPKRRTRSQKTLSPVPSPTFSEGSVLSEIPEVSPPTKRLSLWQAKDSTSKSSPTSVTPISSASPAKLSSGARSDSASKSSETRVDSPKLRTSFSAPRELKLSNASPSAEAIIATDGTDSTANSVDAVETKMRRSRGRLSLSKSPKFVTTIIDDSPEIMQEGGSDVSDPKSTSTEEREFDQESIKLSEALSPSEPLELEQSRRKSGRQSLSTSSSEKAPRDSLSRKSLSSIKSPEIEKFQGTGEEESENVEASSKSEKSRRLSLSRLSLSSLKSPGLEKSRRDSSGRASLSSDKFPEPEESLSPKRPSLFSFFKSSPVEKSMDSTESKSVSPVKSVGLVKSPDIEQVPRVCISRLSISSNKSSPSKLDEPAQLPSMESRNSNGSCAFVVQNLDELPQCSPLKIADSSLNFVVSDNDKSLRKSVGRRSTSPAKSSPGFSLKFDVSALNDSEEKNSSPDSISAEDSFHVSIADPNTRRFSTGNLAFKKSFESDLFKHRASTGPVVNRSAPKKEDTLELVVAMGVSINSLPTDDQMNTSDDCKLSPIKQKTDLKRLTLTPSSSDESFNGTTNNKLEKSTIFIDGDDLSDNDMFEELSSTEYKCTKQDSVSKSGSEILLDSDKKSSQKRRSSVLPAPEASSDKEVAPHEPIAKGSSLKRRSSVLPAPEASIDEEEAPHEPIAKESTLKRRSSVLSAPKENSDEVEVPHQSSGPSKPSRLSEKFYRDAAVMLNGDDLDHLALDSDDNQCELVYSPGTKSKKERRLEKKALRKAEKEAKMKAKGERQARLLATSKNKAEKLSKSEEASKSMGMPEEGTKTSDHETNSSLELHSFILHESNRISVGSKFSGKKARRSSELEQNIGSVCENFAGEISLLKGLSCSSQQSLIDTKQGELVEPGDSEKNTNKSKTDISKNESYDCGVLASETKLNKAVESEQEEIEEALEGSHGIVEGKESVKTKKVKKLKKIAVKEAAEIVNTSESSDVTGHSEKKKKKKVKNAAEEEPVVLKKKKKSKADNDEPIFLKEKKNSGCAAGDEPVVLKKKKKKKSESAVGDESVLKKKKKSESAVENESVVLKKKKKKVDVVGGDEPIVLKKKKKLKNVFENEPVVAKKKMSVNSAEDEPVQIKKKKKKKLGNANELASVASNVHVDGTMRKIKKSKVQEEQHDYVEGGCGSDSDDAPTAVSFESGKQVALAELQAATENIKKQKELKLKKLKAKQDRIRKEKSEKMWKLEQKKLQKVKESDPQGVASGFVSEIHIGKEGLQSSNMRPPKRLPADVLESLTEQPPTKLVKRADGTKERVVLLSNEEQERIEKQKAKKLARKLQKRSLMQSDYIPLDGPLGSTRFGVVPLRNIMLAKKMEQSKISDTAANFRQQTLFGNRIRRTPISSLLAHKEKLKASGRSSK